MEKKQLAALLHHYSGSTAQEAAEVISLRNEYPYSQVLQALSARVSKDHNLDNQQLLLQSAAVYVTDRAVLKEIMSKVQEAPKIKEEIRVTVKEEHVVETKENGKPEQVTEVKAEVKEARKETKTSPGVFPEVQRAVDSIDYATEVIQDLKQLNKLKHNFEELAANFGHDGTAQPEEKTKRKPPVRTKKKAEEHADPLIEAIKTNKKKIDPENPKAKEQIAIIDEFIKAQPSIKPKTESSDGGDLTEVKNGEFADNIISETLAEILIRQGKKEKAIEVYKKLIWKFPQKKAYFAAQIEELKK